MNSNSERRHFQRVDFDHSGMLTLGKVSCDCKLIDISLKGALVEVAKADGAQINQGTKGSALFKLSNDVNDICMDIEVMHIENARIGLRCTHIDLDSISHLRRLIELNTGDPELLDRELLALVKR